ncbi:RHS repeat-associated core domain-containing protein [Cyclobacterium lianum]|uniref:RHS repeat-associated core domain-containing protein n=1 Tax=Cyclobacterium lianum TaxID=388280 RepID=A0A1M7NCK1_9BACT|nr:DUF6443 domain-containing protein [Cyclobacterium lianum]SHN01417.1 RHS repeat-associated core domain-containing protein [Cyclobacterium lianum]
MKILFNVFLSFSIGSLFAQVNVTAVKISGPASVEIGEEAVFTVNFHTEGYRLNGPVNGSYNWMHSGGQSVHSDISGLRLTFENAGDHEVFYGYSEFGSYFYDSKTVTVKGRSICPQISPSAPEVTLIRKGRARLEANPAPDGFAYRWFDSDQISQLSASRKFLTPLLTSSKIYYLAYQDKATGCMTGKVPIRVNVLPENRNRISTYQARKPIRSVADLLESAGESAYQSNTYFDGIGRVEQLVKVQANSIGQDLVIPLAYDELGRQALELLPFPAEGQQSGLFRENAFDQQRDYYRKTFGDPFGYQETAFESSPLNRMAKKAAPGKDWKMGTGKELKFSRRANTVQDGVKWFEVNEQGLPQLRGEWPAGSLWVEITDNEDNLRTLVFTDRQGRELLKKTQLTASDESGGHTGWLSTYHVFDDFGHLRVVMPPKAVEILNAKGWQLSADITLANAQYFRYRYDGKRRVVEKKLPGKAVEYLLYDRLDRQVGFQDGELRKEGNWQYILYDAFDRPVKTGLTTDSRSQDEIQQELDKQLGIIHLQNNRKTGKIKSGKHLVSSRYTGHEAFQASESIILRPGFHFRASGNSSFSGTIAEVENTENAVFPKEEGEILTLNYYDKYENTPAGKYKQAAGFPPSPSSRTTGLLTATKVKDLETGRYYTNTYFYDDKGREIQSIEEAPLEGTIRRSIRYNFENQVTETLTELSRPIPMKISKYYSYDQAGLLTRISQRIGDGDLITIANYSYDALGRKAAVHFSYIPDAAQEYRYNIRGWLQEMRGASSGLFSQTLTYQESGKRWDGNITGSRWSGMDSTVRQYDYGYDKTGRLLKADYSVATSAGENNRYSLDHISYDANGNIKTLKRRGATSENQFGLLDDLHYQYESDPRLGEFGNQLTRVMDDQSGLAHISADFKPKPFPGQYSYDANGNQRINQDKGISDISYNLLNLPEEFTFSNGDQLRYAYDAEGRKLRETLYRKGKLIKDTQYIGDFVFVNGRLDHLLHEEGRVVFESGKAIYEFFLRDHLGNVRQVLRAPQTERVTATMEMTNGKTEAEAFGQIAASRQLGPEHNTTPGGTQVAWLNASRGRLLGPSRRQEVGKGSRLKLTVQVKYEDPRKSSVLPEDFVKMGVREGLIADLREFGLAGSVPTSLGVFQLVDLVIRDLQQKEAPEAYMMYALYDGEGKLYESGKELLSKKAANGHEKLEKELYISQEGYMEAFLVNETSENVWFDDFTVETTPSPVVQETHYDPWGLELTGLGYRREGVKENRYLYNGKELIEDLNLNLYDYGARYFDPVIGRWTSPDPMASEREWLSPYNYVQNNPLLRIDPDGMLDEYNYNIDSGEIEWVSDLGGNEVQFVNVVNSKGERLGRGSVSGSEVYVYRLRESVVLTNFDAQFDDKSYNRKNGYQYSLADFQLRNEYRKTDNVFGSFINKAEKEGKAQPISSRDDEMRFGYLTSRLKMMGSAIELGLTLTDPNPTGKPFIVGSSRFFSQTVGATGSQGVRALTNSNSNWNAFLKANTGKYSGAGWQRRAAADYYKSSFYKK